MNASKVFGAAATGFLAGVIAGILFAPKSGHETREDLARLVGRMKADIENKLKNMSKVTRETYNDAIENVVDKYENSREITSQEASRLKAKLAEGYDEVKSKTDNGK